MNFFFDNNLSRRLARSLHELSQPDHSVVHLKDKFSPKTDDADWIRALVKERKDWIIVTADVSMQRTPHELEAVRESGLTAFFLVPAWSHVGHWVKAAKLIKIWPQIMSNAGSIERGVAFEVPIRGRLRPLW